VAMTRIYLDVSCLNRPFDDQSQPRVRLESEAVTMILESIDAGRWEQVSSRIAEIELNAMIDPVRRRRVLQLLPQHRMELTPDVFGRARELTALGLKAADAVHVAAAESLPVEVLLTCDDRLLKRCVRLADQIHVRVANPLTWLEEQNRAPNIG
jgi:predicted nucleic acid-binding protein